MAAISSFRWHRRACRGVAAERLFLTHGCWSVARQVVGELLGRAYVVLEDGGVDIQSLGLERRLACVQLVVEHPPVLARGGRAALRIARVVSSSTLILDWRPGSGHELDLDP